MGVKRINPPPLPKPCRPELSEEGSGTGLIVMFLIFVFLILLGIGGAIYHDIPIIEDSCAQDFERFGADDYKTTYLHCYLYFDDVGWVDVSEVRQNALSGKFGE